jgi:outer membrane protein TolC
MRTTLLLAFGLPLLAQPATLTLAEAEAAALAHHPDLAAAAADQQAAQARLELAEAQRLGRLEATLQWAPAVRNPSLDVPGAAQPFTLDLQDHELASLTLDQPVWTWGSLGGQARAAALELDSAGAARERRAQQVRFQATRAYLQAQAADAAVAVARTALDQQHAFQAMAEDRVRAGSAPRLDQLKADLAVSGAEADLVARRDAAREAREELVAATEEPGFREAGLAPEPPAVLPAKEPAELVARALARRPDLRQIQRLAEAQQTGARAQRAAGLPSVSVVGSITQQNGSWDGLLQADNRTYLLGLALRWDGLARRRARAQAAATLAESRASQAQGRSLADQVELEVRNGWLRVQDALARVRLADTSLAQAEEQARVARLAYREGVTTAVEAQDAELDLSRARYQVLVAGLDRDLASAELALAVGEPDR